jgi:mannan endo-1,4-beta-mannosidase
VKRKKQYFEYGILLLSLLLLQGLVGCSKTTTVPMPTSTSTETPTLAKTTTPLPTLTPTHVVVERAQVLDFIASLSLASKFRGAISGQNAYHGDEITDDAYLRGYRTMIEALHDKTGEWPGIIGVDYEWARAFTPAQLSDANEVLINYAQNGGMVMVTFTPQNPWVNDESDLVNNPGSGDGPSSTTSKLPPGARLDDLLDPGKTVSASWKRKLDRIAAALLELKKAGVVVLFRPMQEMNGVWFWWGIDSHRTDPGPYIRVFRAMRDYFTKDKGLDNLIWVYSPTSTYGNETVTNYVFRAVDWAYPGDNYVDIIAGTNYADDMSISDYGTYVKMGKPLGIAEYGPNSEGPYFKNGTWDLSRIIERIKNEYPRIAFWVCWHSYPGSSWSMISNLNADILLADPFVINRDTLPWNIR